MLLLLPDAIPVQQNEGGNSPHTQAQNGVTVSEFWNKLLFLIAELTIAKDPLINEVDAFTDGHRKNVPMSPEQTDSVSVVVLFSDINLRLH